MGRDALPRKLDTDSPPEPTYYQISSAEMAGPSPDKRENRLPGRAQPQTFAVQRQNSQKGRRQRRRQCHSSLIVNDHPLKRVACERKFASPR